MPVYNVRTKSGALIPVEAPEGTSENSILQTAAYIEAEQQLAAPPQPTGSDFMRGLKQRLYGIPGDFGALQVLKGDLTDDEEAMRAGMARMEASEKDVAGLGTKQTDTFLEAIEDPVAFATDYVPLLTGQVTGMFMEMIGLTAGASVLTGPAGTVSGVSALVGKGLLKKGIKGEARRRAKEKGIESAKQYVAKEVSTELARLQGTKEGKRRINEELRKFVKPATAGVVYSSWGAGETMGRVMEEIGKETDDPEEQLRLLQEKSGSKLAMVSGAHAIANMIGYKIFGRAMEGLAKPTRSYLLNIAKRWGIAGIQEAPVEALQTALELYAADLPLDDAEAIKEYINAAGAGFVMPLAPATIGAIRTGRAPKESKDETTKTDATKVTDKAATDADQLPAESQAEISAQALNNEELQTEIDELNSSLETTGNPEIRAGIEELIVVNKAEQAKRAADLDLYEHYEPEALPSPPPETPRSEFDEVVETIEAVNPNYKGRTREDIQAELNDAILARDVPDDFGSVEDPTLTDYISELQEELDARDIQADQNIIAREDAGETIDPSKLQPGQQVELYRPDGTKELVTVIAVGEEGTVKFKTKDGKEHIDGMGLELFDPTSPANLKKIFEGTTYDGKPIIEVLETLTLEELQKIAKTYKESYETTKDRAESAKYIWLNKHNAVKSIINRRKQEDAQETEAGTAETFRGAIDEPITKKFLLENDFKKGWPEYKKAPVGPLSNPEVYLYYEALADQPVNVSELTDPQIKRIEKVKEASNKILNRVERPTDGIIDYRITTEPEVSRNNIEQQEGEKDNVRQQQRSAFDARVSQFDDRATRAGARVPGKPPAGDITEGALNPDGTRVDGRSPDLPATAGRTGELATPLKGEELERALKTFGENLASLLDPKSKNKKDLYGTTEYRLVNAYENNLKLFRVFQAENPRTVGEALKLLSKNRPLLDPATLELVTAFRNAKNIQNVPFTFGRVPYRENAMGYYDPQNKFIIINDKESMWDGNDIKEWINSFTETGELNKIYIGETKFYSIPVGSKNTISSPELDTLPDLANTILHEVRHALTLEGLEKHVSTRDGSLTPRDGSKIGKDAIAIFTAYKQAFPYTYASTNIYDFFAEATSSPVIMTQLNSLPSVIKSQKTSKSLLDNFIFALKRLLGLKTSDTLFADFLALSPKVELGIKSFDVDAVYETEVKEFTRKVVPDKYGSALGEVNTLQETDPEIVKMLDRKEFPQQAVAMEQKAAEKVRRNLERARGKQEEAIRGEGLPTDLQFMGLRSTRTPHWKKIQKLIDREDKKLSKLIERRNSNYKTLDNLQFGEYGLKNLNYQEANEQRKDERDFTPNDPARKKYDNRRKSLMIAIDATNESLKKLNQEIADLEIKLADLKTEQIEGDPQKALFAATPTGKPPTEKKIIDQASKIPDGPTTTDDIRDAGRVSLSQHNPKNYTELINVVGQVVRTQPVYSKGLMEGIRDVFSKFSSWAQKYYIRILSLSQIFELFPDVPGVNTLEKTVEKRASALDEAATKLSKFQLEMSRVLDQYRNTPVFDKWTDITYELSRQNIHPGKEKNKDHALVKEFKTLPQDLQDIAIGMHNSLVQRSMEALDALEKMSGRKVDYLRKEFDEKQLEFYQPFMRDGDYWFDYQIQTKEGLETVVIAAQTPRERERLKEEAKTKKDFVKFTDEGYSRPTPAKDSPPDREMYDYIQELLSRADISADVKDTLTDQITEQFLSRFRAESVQAASRHRHGFHGFIKDLEYGFANASNRSIKNINDITYLPDIKSALNEIKANVSKGGSGKGYRKGIYEAINDRASFFLNPVAESWASTASFSSYAWYIGGNLSSAFVNLTQMPIVVAPMLGLDYGIGKSVSALENARKLYFQGDLEGKAKLKNRSTWETRNIPDYTMEEGFNAEQKQKYGALFKTANERMTLTRGLIHESIDFNSNTKLGQSANLVNQALGWTFKNSERANRELTLVAAYDLARGAGDSEQMAIEKAIKLTIKAHSHALPEAGPLLFQSGIGKVAFTFKRFAQAQIYLVSQLLGRSFNLSYHLTKDKKRKLTKKEMNIARKQLMGISGMAYMFAGVQGLPFYGAADALASLLVDDEEDPFLLDDFVKQSIGEVGYKGPLTAAFNVDIGARTGFRGLMWRADRRRREEVGEAVYIAEHFLGPSWSILTGIDRGIEDINEGNITRGVEQIIPTWARNGVKTFRFATEGATTRKGLKIVDDPNAYNLFMQLFGFSNSDLSQAYERVAIMKFKEKKVSGLRTKLLLNYYLATVAGDSNGMNRIQKKIDKFNTKNPEIAITGKTLNNSRKTFDRKALEAVHGVSFNPKMRDRLIEESDYDEDEEDFFYND